PDGQVGEIWLHGNNIGRGYWGRPDETRRTFGASLRSRLPHESHAHGTPVDGSWLRTGDLGMYLDGELYVTGRIADLIAIGGRHQYPQDIENTVAEAASMVRRGYAAAFSVPANELLCGDTDNTDERLVVIAERAVGTARTNPQAAIDAIKAAVSQRHQLAV